VGEEWRKMVKKKDLVYEKEKEKRKGEGRGQRKRRVKKARVEERKV
jgi:hypothetical protein